MKPMNSQEDEAVVERLTDRYPHLEARSLLDLVQTPDVMRDRASGLKWGKGFFSCVRRVMDPDAMNRVHQVLMEDTARGFESVAEVLRSHEDQFAELEGSAGYLHEVVGRLYLHRESDRSDFKQLESCVKGIESRVDELQREVADLQIGAGARRDLVDAISALREGLHVERSPLLGIVLEIDALLWGRFGACLTRLSSQDARKERRGLVNEIAGVLGGVLGVDANSEFIEPRQVAERSNETLEVMEAELIRELADAEPGPRPMLALLSGEGPGEDRVIRVPYVTTPRRMVDLIVQELDSARPTASLVEVQR